MCLYVRVCLWERKRKREREKERKREREKERKRERERERYWSVVCVAFERISWYISVIIFFAMFKSLLRLAFVEIMLRSNGEGKSASNQKKSHFTNLASVSPVKC